MENCKCYDLICNGQILGPEMIMENGHIPNPDCS